MANRTSAVVEMALEVPSSSSGRPYRLLAATPNAMTGSALGGSSGNASSPSALSFWAQEEKELLRYAREFDRHLTRLFATQRAVARLSSHVLDNTMQLQMPNAGSPSATNLSDLEKDLEADQKALRSTLTDIYDAIANYTLRRYVVAQLPDTRVLCLCMSCKATVS